MLYACTQTGISIPAPFTRTLTVRPHHYTSKNPWGFQLLHFELVYLLLFNSVQFSDINFILIMNFSTLATCPSHPLRSKINLQHTLDTEYETESGFGVYVGLFF